MSGVWAAITLRELGYTNVTILEKERRVGGKAASFAYAGQSYPLGAVGTPLALETASFSDAYGKGALRAARSLLGRAGRRLRVLNANNLVVGSSWPRPFPKAELTAQAPVADWKSAFGAKGAPERFYPHRLDFATGRSADLAARPLAKIVPRWGQPSTSWPLVYVSAHGYGVAAASDAPPYYYWQRFAQKSTNAGAAGPLGAAFPGHNPLGPRGPALRGWDSSSLFDERLAAAGVQVRTNARVSRIERGADRVTVTTDDGGVAEYDKLVLAADLAGSLQYLDASADERDLFGAIRHLPYWTVTAFVSLPWLATHRVYYLADHQGGAAPSGADAGRTTALLCSALAAAISSHSWSSARPVGCFGGRHAPGRAAASLAAPTSTPLASSSVSIRLSSFVCSSCTALTLDACRAHAIFSVGQAPNFELYRFLVFPWVS